jgi:hypothetical protein
VELFFNLVWLSVSVVLFTWWMRSIVDDRANLNWSPVIALGLLLVLLFPVISMTDDLVAMSTPVEVEHMLRRSEAPLMHVSSVDLMHSVALVSLTILAVVAPRFADVEPHPVSAALLAGFVRAVGVRPPPTATRAA